MQQSREELKAQVVKHLEETYDFQPQGYEIYISELTEEDKAARRLPSVFVMRSPISLNLTFKESD